MSYNSGDEIGVFTVFALLGKRAIYVKHPDGSNTLIQENGYTKESILEMFKQGCKFFID